MECWEFKKCGKDKEGAGTCPAYPDHGNTCARIAGTLCGGKVQGMFAAKLANCMACDYYQSEHYNKQYSGK